MENFSFFKEVSEHNILPLTGQCNCRCLFCSHGNNPEGTKIWRGKAKDFATVFNALDFLDKDRKIIIGESASPISEGEPFLYPHFREVLFAIRQKFSQTPISITTNGTRLTEEMILTLKEVGNISLCISLNTLNFRREMMGDATNTAIEALPLLARVGIPFDGSMVLMPEVTGWPDIAATLAYLHRWGALTVRMILPGYGRMAQDCRFYDSRERRATAKSLLDRQPGVTLLEPPLYENNLPLVYGVIADSLAQRAGFRRNDRILGVNSQEPRNRFEAWFLLQQQKQCDVIVKRNTKTIKISYRKPKGSLGGFVFENDLDISRLEAMERIVLKEKGNAVICCSSLGFPYLKGNLSLFPVLHKIPVVIAKNHYFGGNLGAAGLLTVSDFQQALKGINAEYAFLPQEAFSVGGQDLTGNTTDAMTIRTWII